MKKQIFKFIASVILISLVSVNFLPPANAQQAQSSSPQRGKMTPEQRVDMRVNRMKQNLNLTDDQVLKVKQLFLQQESDRAANKGEAPSADRTAMMTDLAKILTPEQMEKFKQMRSQQGMQKRQAAPENK